MAIKNINITNGGCRILVHKLPSSIISRIGDGKMKTIKGQRIYIEDEHGQYNDDPRLIFAKKVALGYLDKLENDWEIEVSIKPHRLI